MSDLTPLQVWGQPREGDIEALRAAKTALSLPFRVLPVPAVPGGPTRVLALREAPPFLCDYALVRDPANPAALEAAMAWVLNPQKGDPRAVLVIDMLRAIFGDDVTEVPHVADGENVSGVRFV